MLILKKQDPCRKNLRHAEYYNLTEVFDNLYKSSQQNVVFKNLMPIIGSDDNIRLAYRNIKRNRGSNTAGVDGRTVKDIEKISEQDFISKVKRKLSYYKPKPVKRVEIPKQNGKMRPLGIPTIIDRIVQQCIMQVLDPICEAKFHERSYGFRPNRSAENAISACQNSIQLQKLHFVVDIDIKGFFDNVSHSKLKKQIWTMGIQDKQLLCIISEMLKAPIIMPNGERTIPDKGTPQGGILSPLLSNIVLNELDWWIASQWENFSTRHQYCTPINSNGSENKGSKYKSLKAFSSLKEVFIVRYADDFKLFCRKREDAIKLFYATQKWLEERLKLEISVEKSKIVNLKKQYSEFLGFKFKTIERGKKYVVKSHMSDKAINRICQMLIKKVKTIQRPVCKKQEAIAVNIYNLMVMGVHNYYQIANCVNIDCHKIARQIDIVLKNRLSGRLTRTGKLEKGYIRQVYGKSKQLRFIHGKPIIPIAYIRHKYPFGKRRSVCKYTVEGRQEIHKSLKINTDILFKLAQTKISDRSIEYMDNRLSLYAGQYGKCAITGQLLNYDEIHCHHILPLQFGGDDRYSNLIIVHIDVHRLIHATLPETTRKYLAIVNPDKNMITKINKLRETAKLELI